MQKIELYKQLISDFAIDGQVTEAEEYILFEKGKELGFSENSIKTMIELELVNDNTKSKLEYEETEIITIDRTYKFKSAITRLGPILTPHIIEIVGTDLIYKKRNKYLINVDVTTISISRIASIKIDTSLLGTDIIIESTGSDTIIAENFTKTDAKTIQRLIQEIQRNL